MFYYDTTDYENGLFVFLCGQGYFIFFLGHLLERSSVELEDP